MKTVIALFLLCGALGANAGCPVKKPGSPPALPDGSVAGKEEMHRAQLAAEKYMLQAKAYLDCGVMNHRQHNQFVAQLELFADAYQEEQVEYQVRSNMIAEK